MLTVLRAHYLYYTGLGSRIRKLLGNEQYVFADRSTIWLIFINCFHCSSDAGEIKVLFDVAQLNELSSVRKIEYVSCTFECRALMVWGWWGMHYGLFIEHFENKSKILKIKLVCITVIFPFFPLAFPSPFICSLQTCLLFKCMWCSIDIIFWCAVLIAFLL